MLVWDGLQAVPKPGFNGTHLRAPILNGIRSFLQPLIAGIFFLYLWDRKGVFVPFITPIYNYD